MREIGVKMYFVLNAISSRPPDLIHSVRLCQPLRESESMPRKNHKQYSTRVNTDEINLGVQRLPILNASERKNRKALILLKPP